MRSVIIGYGNQLRGDDGLGWVVTDRLREMMAGTEIEILALHQLTPELMETLSRAERAVFIDASAVGEPGSIAERALQPAGDGRSFTHHASPEALLAGALALYGHAPEAVLISVAAANFSPETELSAAVAARVEEVARRALHLVANR